MKTISNNFLLRSFLEQIKHKYNKISITQIILLNQSYTHIEKGLK